MVQSGYSAQSIDVVASVQNPHDAPLQCNVQSQHDDPLQCNVQNQHVDSCQWNVQSQHVTPSAVPRVVWVRTGLIGDHSGHLRSDWLKLGILGDWF